MKTSLINIQWLELQMANYRSQHPDKTDDEIWARRSSSSRRVASPSAPSQTPPRTQPPARRFAPFALHTLPPPLHSPMRLLFLLHQAPCPACPLPGGQAHTDTPRLSPGAPAPPPPPASAPRPPRMPVRISRTAPKRPAHRGSGGGGTHQAREGVSG